MSKLTLYLPRILLFGVMVVVGFVISSAVVLALQDRSPQSAATEAPDYLLAGAPDTPRRVARAGGVQRRAVRARPVPLESLAPADLTAAADSLLGAEPAVYKNPSGFPRIPPITQFDGGPFQGANCTLASGAMLARLGVRDRDLRIGAAHAPGRPGRRDRPQRPQQGPVARLRGHASRPVPAARPAEVPARRGLRRGDPGRLRRRSRARSASRRTSSAATRSTSTATTRATRTRASPRPTT